MKFYKSVLHLWFSLFIFNTYTVILSSYNTLFTILLLMVHELIHIEIKKILDFNRKFLSLIH